MRASDAIPMNHSRRGDPEFCCDPWQEDNDPGDDYAVHRYHFRPGASKAAGALIWCCCKSVLTRIEPEPVMTGEIPEALTPPSSEPGRRDFRTALTHLIHEYALDVQAGRPAVEIATVMDEARIRFDKETRDAR